MQNYLFFESRDPMENRDKDFTQNLARNLTKEGNKTVVFLVENGVFSARPSSFSNSLKELMKDGVEIWADSFSLQERAIGECIPGIKVQNMKDVISCLSDGYKVIWH